MPKGIKGFQKGHPYFEKTFAGFKRIGLATKKRWQNSDYRKKMIPLLLRYGFQKGNENITKRPEIREKIRNALKGKKPSNWKTLYTPQINEKRRKARLKQKLPTIDTSIELKVKKWLEEKEIRYLHPYNLKNKF